MIWLVWNKKDSGSGDTGATGILLERFPNSIESSDSTPNSSRFFVTLILSSSLSKKQHISKEVILCKANRTHNTPFPTSEFCCVFRMKKKGMLQKSIIISQKLHGKVVAKCANFNLVFCYFVAVFKKYSVVGSGHTKTNFEVELFLQKYIYRHLSKFCVANSGVYQ